jgi:NAD-dependent dihydropyrimidine dehydrogenase PreA subunit
VRKDGLFIAVEVDDDAAADSELALALVEQNLDECVLCRLCLDASPEGVVKIIKLYDGGAVL